jgi:hypothetical protein
VRQFSQRQKAGSTKSLGLSTLSFSFNPPISIEKRTLETWNWAPKDSRNDLSTGSSGFGTSQRTKTSSDPQSLEQASTSSAYTPASHAHPRIPEKHRLLPELSNISIFESSFNHQYHRINEPVNSRSDAPMRQSTNSRSTSALDNSFYTNTTKNGV